MAVSVAAPVSTPESHPAPDQPERQVIHGICGVCPAGCGVKITMEDGRIKQTATRPKSSIPRIDCYTR
jgi:anaerobic selenocysteine-containing dehydrogenase